MQYSRQTLTVSDFKVCGGVQKYIFLSIPQVILMQLVCKPTGARGNMSKITGFLNFFSYK